MSRRAVPESTAERNRNTLKQLVKLEQNKSCSDCKKNKHPRWASWNLGVFICIRCSGIHRGMGTHISRVKSVDLDTWTDEQLQSMIKWGNARANKYWEAKLAPGHVPAEAKIENFIRTKYESKRWSMEGPVPDPSTLDVEGDEDLPLSVVQDKVKIERSASQRASGSGSGPAPPSRVSRAPQNSAQNVDLFGDDPLSGPPRPSTGPPSNKAAPPPKAKPKAAQPADSLLGLDFLSGPTVAPPSRPSSNPAPAGNGPPRVDLKQSILSLYASKPAPPPQPQQQSSQSGLYGQQRSPPTSSAFSGMSDAFSGLDFGQPAQQAVKPSAFDGLDSGVKSLRQTAPKPVTSSFAPGGSFFDAPTSSPSVSRPPQPAVKQQSFGGFGDFTSAAPVAAKSPQPSTQSNDLFDLMGDSMPAPVLATKPQSSVAATPSYSNSAFNLSQPAPAPAPAAAKSPAINLTSNFDAWGSSNAWSDSKPTTSTTITNATASSSAGDFGGWGSSTTTSSNAFGSSKAAPQVSADEDFGEWGHASPVATTSSAPAPPPKQGGGFNANNDDLFSNVWQ